MEPSYRKLALLSFFFFFGPPSATLFDKVNVVNQQAAAGPVRENTPSEVAVPVKSKPAPVKQPTEQRRRRRPQEQPSTRTPLRNAFEAFLWLTRCSNPHQTETTDSPEEAEEEATSQFVASGMGKPSPYIHNGRSSEHATYPGPVTMQYYHVDSAENENEIYQQWVNLLGPSMGGAWVPASHPKYDFSRRPCSF